VNVPTDAWDLGLCPSADWGKALTGQIRDRLINSLIPQGYYRRSWILFTHKKVYYCLLLDKKDTFDVIIKSSINNFLSFKGLIVVYIHTYMLSCVWVTTDAVWIGKLLNAYRSWQQLTIALSLIHTLSNSLQQVLILLSLLCLHQSLSGNDFRVHVLLAGDCLSTSLTLDLSCL
jgi:hypothetical protein